MFIHITSVTHEGGYKLRLEFDDGVVRTVDLENELIGPVFEPLRDLAMFRKVTVNRETGTIEWPNGADFAPEFLHELGSSADSTPARKVAETRVLYGTRA